MTTTLQTASDPLLTIPARRYRALWEPCLFYAIVLLHLIPVWSVRYLPTQDGPAHVYNAQIMGQYFLPAGRPARAFFSLVGHPVPNLLGHVAMALLMFVVRPEVAEKLTVSAYLLLLPLGARYAVGAVRRDSKFLACLVLPLLYGKLHSFGFYNFNLGLGLFCFLAGYWFKHRTRLTPTRLTLMGIGSIVLCLTHVVPVLALITVVGAVEMWFALLDWRAVPPGDPRRRAIGRRLALMAAAPLALAAFGAFYLLRTEASEPAFTLGQMVRRLVQLQVLVSYQERETWGATAFAGLLAVMTLTVLWRKWSGGLWDRWDVLLSVTGLFLALYLHARDSTAARFYLAERLCLFAILVQMLWLAAQAHGPMVRRLVPVGACGIAAFLLGLHAARYARVEPYLREYVSAAPYVRPDSVFLPVVFHPHGQDRHGQPLSEWTWPFWHTSGYVATARHAVDLSNYEAHTKIFPTRFRTGLDALQVMPQLYTETDAPPEPRPREYEQQAGKQIDYVLLWGYTAADATKAEASELTRQLAEFRLVYVSKPRGMMRVYERASALPIDTSITAVDPGS